MALIKVLALVFVVLFAAPSFIHVAEAQRITCSQVVNSLMPCVDYLMNGGAVPSNCCVGVKNLYGAANTTPNRQAICTCLKQALGSVSYSSNNLRNAQSLPGRCQVKIPYKIDPSTDCSRIRY